MRAIIVMIALLAFSTSSARGETLYIGRLSVLNPNGKFEQHIIQGTGQGLSLTECQLRIDVWLQAHESSLKLAVAILKEKGKPSSYKVECEAK